MQLRQRHREFRPENKSAKKMKNHKSRETAWQSSAGKEDECVNGIVGGQQGKTVTDLNVINATTDQVAPVVYCQTSYSPDENPGQGICCPCYPLTAGSKRGQKTCGARHETIVPK
jgi:hypothetical protein